MLQIGYACLTTGVRQHDYRTITKKYLDKTRLYEVIAANLATLGRMLDYNHANNIKLFRISSDLIPFGSSELNQFPWAEDFTGEFAQLAEKIASYQMRFSMHPGQYTVLNSPREEVVAAARADLAYHTKIFQLLGGNQTNKMIVHIGGIYGDKPAAIERFIANYQQLSPEIKRHLVIENDDHFYPLADVMTISGRTGIPVIFDLFHHQVLASFPGVGLDSLIDLVATTWAKDDGRMKIHYSQPDEAKRGGAHSLTINSQDFLATFARYQQADLDVMLEVKDKNLSAIKCQQLVFEQGEISLLEDAWAKYKYLVLEHSPAVYTQIRGLLKAKDQYPVQEFYRLIELALATPPTIGSVVNAAEHVWGYFKKTASEKEKRQFEQALADVKSDINTRKTLKRRLLKLAESHQEQYLLDSYYFYLDGFAAVQ